MEQITILLSAATIVLAAQCPFINGMLNLISLICRSNTITYYIYNNNLYTFVYIIYTFDCYSRWNFWLNCMTINIVARSRIRYNIAYNLDINSDF